MHYPVNDEWKSFRKLIIIIIRLWLRVSNAKDAYSNRPCTHNCINSFFFLLFVSSRPTTCLRFTFCYRTRFASATKSVCLTFVSVPYNGKIFAYLIFSKLFNHNYNITVVILFLLLLLLSSIFVIPRPWIRILIKITPLSVLGVRISSRHLCIRRADHTARRMFNWYFDNNLSQTRTLTAFIVNLYEHCRREFHAGNIVSRSGICIDHLVEVHADSTVTLMNRLLPRLFRHNTSDCSLYWFEFQYK